MNSTFTLWQLLQEQPVVIPKVQRDYAQGRKGKEYIREMFLGNLEECLSEGKTMTLDFVYGNTEEGKFYPLDGQQRLTTLWLLHWYLAFRLNKLKEAEIGNTLKKFSYQTRDSSRNFCEKLCNEMCKADPQKVSDVVEYIKGQTWFFTEWMQDPTVDAMLRTLGGDKKAASKENIQQFFRGDLSTYWKNLTEENCVVFERMIIGSEQLPISDDLYIKMNARGKKLTDFENFKADWVADIEKNDALDAKIGEETYKQYYPRRIDQDWTDVFWNSRISAKPKDFDGNIDSIFFSFINRYALNQLCLKDRPVNDYNSRKNPAGESEAEKKTRELQRIFDALYGTGLGKGKSPIDDSLITYKGFDPYREFLKEENLQALDNIFGQLKEDPHRLTLLSFSGLDEDEELHETDHPEITFHFLPQYTEKDGLAATTLKERIYFHAMCLFLEKPKWDRLEEWKRVVRNLVENAAIENQEAMIGCLREIDGLGKLLRENGWDVYKHLEDYRLEHTSISQFVNQWEEEKQKAAKIASDELWTEKILAAEKHAFFKGTIRFLYTGPDGITLDWDNFDTKFKNAKKRFKDNVVGAGTIKLFLQQFTSFDDIYNTAKEGYFFTTTGFHARNHCWKKGILCNKNLAKQVHSFLMNEPSKVADGKYDRFLKSKAVGYISEWSHNYNYRYNYSKGWGVLRDSHATEGIYTSDERLAKNRILLKLKDDKQISFDDAIDLGNDFLWGKKITFTYHNKPYCWVIEDGKEWIHPEEAPEARQEWSDDMEKDAVLMLL